SLGDHVSEGRTLVAGAGSKLQDRAAEDGVVRAEAALVSLKRAREQLLDPITVLRELAQGELELAQQTGAAATGDKLPAWLAPGAIGERQGSLRERVEEVHARLEAGAQSEGKDDQQKKLLERAKIATPLVADASAAMR